MKQRFRDIETFLGALPEDELGIVEWLRGLIFSVIPDCREALAYNVPFYSRSRRICFIWPASVPWGGNREGVRLGFTFGYALQDPENILTKGSRKEVYVIDFRDIDHGIEPALIQLLADAVEVESML